MGILWLTVVSFAGYVMFKIVTFDLFENENKVIKEIQIPANRNTIRIYYIPSNATTECYIQVRKIENGKEEILKSFERYNFLDDYTLIGPDSVRLILRDTSFTNSIIDTVVVKF